MERKFEIGDTVRIIAGQNRGYYGKVKDIRVNNGYPDLYKITVHGVRNPITYDGTFIYEDNCLKRYIPNGTLLNDLLELNKELKKVDDLTKSCTFVNGVDYIPLHIIKVIFNNPATIVFWSDGTKTVVKCDNKYFDEEKGLAMAISKKVLGNNGNYYNEFKKWLPTIYNA